MSCRVALVPVLKQALTVRLRCGIQRSDGLMAINVRADLAVGVTRGGLLAECGRRTGIWSCKGPQRCDSRFERGVAREES